jgi:hypothetical protein
MNSSPAPNRLLSFLPLLWVLTPGCGGADALAPGEDRLLEPRVETLYQVGSLDGASWDGFTRISSAAFGDEGRLHLLDPQQRRVHVVSPEGAHLRSFGVQGDGPGEFRSPVGIQVLADGRIVVADGGHQAFLLFSPEGRFLRSHPYESGPSMPGSRLQRHGDDAVVAHAQSFRLVSGPGGGPPSLPANVPVLRWSFPPESDPAGAAGGEVLLEAWRPEREPPRPASGGGMVFMPMGAPRALEPGVHFAALPDGRLAVADSSSYRIRVYEARGAEGASPEVFGREMAPQPVTPAIENAERERRLADLEAGGGPQIQIATQGPGGGTQMVPQEQIREMFREQVAQVTFWHEIPVIARLQADMEGRLWVERSAGIGETGPTDLLSSDGSYLGTLPADGVRTPLAFGPGGLAAWVELDELEVPYVRVGRITFP